MITKAELEETINKLTEKFNYISRELESLWQYANDKAVFTNNDHIRQIANRIEHLQFDNYANPSQFADCYRFNRLFKVIEENESVKNLDKIMEYERVMKAIQRLSKSIDKINLENESK